MQELASQSLELVNRELNSTLETARGEIEDYVDGQSDTEALVRAASLLHIAAGALKIVEIHGAALLAEEMEQTCRAIHEARGDHSDRGVESLTRAMVQLPAYLDRLISGGSDVALVLLPLLNDLRAARGQPMLSEGTLLLLNTGPFERLRKGKPKGPTKHYGNTLPVLAQKLRPRFQAALLKWIRGEGGQQHLQELIEASDALEAAAESEPARQLWSVTGGVLLALRTGALEPSVQLKRLLGQADRQLKRLIDSGEQAFVNAPPVDLLNSLLYYVARARSDDPRLVELRRSFGVETVIPDAETIAQAREDLAGPSVKLMRTVAEAIREDLAGVKDVLDIFVRTGMEDQKPLKPQLDMLKKIGDTLGVLGLESARNRIQAEAQALSDIVAGGVINDATPFEAIAASLLEVEDVLDRELVKAHGRESDDAQPGVDQALDSTQFRHVTQAVMRECIVNLAKIKDSVVRVLDDPGALRALDGIGPQLRGIVAGLLMLNKNKAVNVIERIGHNITMRLAPESGVLKPSLIERLADAIVSIEYYMETVALGRADPNYMLDNANRCLELVEGAAARAAAEKPAAAQEPAARPEPEPDATAAEDEPVRLSVMEVDEDRSEPELVEIFIEEAKDELDRIRELLPRWIDEPADQEALIGVRRSFHTLKGSGRVVGAQLLAEFAWSVENLLNRVINQTLKASSAMLDFIREAADTLPALIEQLEIGIRPAQDIDGMIARAFTLAETREDFSDTAIEAQPATASAAATGDKAAAAAMDPVLREIFVKEVREHLATIRSFVALAAAATPPVAISEPLHRACHTLHGSARMAALAPAIALTEPLERHIRTGFEEQRGLTTAAVASLGRFAVEIERLTAALEAGQPLAADSAVIAAVRDIRLAATDDAVSATGYLARPELELESDSEDAATPAATESDDTGYLRMPDPDATGLLPAELSLLDDAPEEIVLEGDDGRADDSDASDDFVASEEIVLEGGEVEDIDDVEADADAGYDAGYDAGAGDAAGVDAAAAAAAADYDPEIAAIFCDEAAELLDQAETELARLKQATASPAALAELKRLMHTLKGGARLAGIIAMGDLSHALETMLPQLAAASSGADSSGMRLAQQALDCLQQMRDAVNSGHGVAAARGLVVALEQFGSTGAAAAPAAKPASPAAKPAAPAPASAQPPTDETRMQPAIDFEMPPEDAGGVTALDLELDAGDSGEAPLTIGEPADEDTRDQPRLVASAADAALPDQGEAAANAAAAAAAAADAAAATAAANASAAASGTAPAVPLPPAPASPPLDHTVAVGSAARGERVETARVDASLLDELLNGAGEISIFQSRLNQQVHSIEFHLGELAQTVTRLREQLRSLEAETEAQILHRHQGEADSDQHFDPLELDRYSTIQQLSRALAESSNDVASINELLQGLTSEADTLLTQQSRVTTQLQDGLMQTRMVSFDRQSTRLARIVRQAAQDSGKEAELRIEGARSQLDRQILEAIVPALEHLLRNAVVHGIESTAKRAAAGKPAAGEITLEVRREGSEVLIEVSDDGAGLDLKTIRRKAVEKGLIQEGDATGDEEIIELILLPGFSTADELTQAAGRGVGMDVVDNEIKRLGGSLRITTEPGKGTRFLIRLPYTLAITHALIVVVGDETFALPLPTVEGIARVRREQLLELLTEDDPRLAHGDGSYRVQHLGSLVGSAPSALPEDESAVSLVLVRAGENSTALLTDSLEGSREIVVKTLGPHIGSVPGVTGATILGDGRVVVILDAGTLVRALHGEVRSSAPVAEARPLTALVVDDSITMRRVTQRLLERRGIKVHTARDGLDAIEVLREHEADVILLDIEMPRMDGYQFATHVRNDAKLKDTPIIMVTSRSGEKHRARAIEIGVNDYLSKPYQEAELVAAIGALVGRKL